MWRHAKNKSMNTPTNSEALPPTNCSPSSLTDSVAETRIVKGKPSEIVDADFARALESSLTKARKEAEECRDAMGSKRVFSWENVELTCRALDLPERSEPLDFPEVRSATCWAGFTTSSAMMRPILILFLPPLL